MTQTTIVPFLQLFFEGRTPGPKLVLEDKYKKRKTVAVVQETRMTYTIFEHVRFAFFFGAPYGLVYQHRELDKKSSEIVEHPVQLRASE